MDLSELFKRTPLALIIIGVILAVISALGNLPIGSQSPQAMENTWRYILAGLGVLLILVGVVLAIVEAQTLNSGKSALMRNSQQKNSIAFSEWDNALFQEKLKTAKEIRFQLLSGYVFFDQNAEFLVNFLNKGGIICCIITDPKSEAIKLAAIRSQGAAAKQEYLTHQINLVLEKLYEIHKKTNFSANLQVKLTTLNPEPIMTILDPQSPDGIMFITLNGFRQPISLRPSFILQKAKDEKWFNFFLKGFDEFWNYSESQVIDLAKYVSVQ